MLLALGGFLSGVMPSFILLKLMNIVLPARLAGARPGSGCAGGCAGGLGPAEGDGRQHVGRFAGAGDGHGEERHGVASAGVRGTGVSWSR